jgi:hypothetical protein
MVTTTQDASEKPSVAEMEAGGRRDGILQDAPIQSGHDVAVKASALPQFAHLDEKKILRKVSHLLWLTERMNAKAEQMDIRLIPMLALLYLLSFLDRKRTTQPQLNICH